MDALKYVPEALRPEEMCLEALGQGRNAMRHQLKGLLAPEIFLEAAAPPDWVAANNLDVLKHILSH
ncbi:hypothetical protein E1297_00250 [Roseibium sp. RKSG952]|nr:hypothetical protein [Roseibium sp. RKSG952]